VSHSRSIIQQSKELLDHYSCKYLMLCGSGQPSNTEHDTCFAHSREDEIESARELGVSGSFKYIGNWSMIFKEDPAGILTYSKNPIVGEKVLF
jgi:hypothetical protein